MNEAHFRAVLAAGKPRVELPRIQADGYGDVMRRKELRPAELAGIASLRDFGGCYLVHGRYLLHATRVRKLGLASMIDVNPLPEYAAAVERARAELPATEFETVQGDFRDPALFAGLRETDAALLYEVLLHQENYVEVLRQVCAKTRRYLCLAQPCLREDFFALPGSAVMLQFWEEPLKELLREGSFWPREARAERFTTAHWMWGHTVTHLVEILRGFGWGLWQGEVVDNVCGPCWEYPLLTFAKR